jgi:hypothetical protein
MHAAHRGKAPHCGAQYQYPPLVLIGAHLDEIEKRPDCDGVLRSIDACLKQTFGGKINSFQPDSDSLIPGREFLYNQSQSLCFFPVNALCCDDVNVSKLRSLLFDAIINDPLEYLNDSIPIPWLRVFDKLGEAREEAQLMKIYSSVDDDELTVVKLMRDVDAQLHIGEDAWMCTDQAPCASCLAQAQAMLQLFHLLGTVVCLSHVQPGLLLLPSMGFPWRCAH